MTVIDQNALAPVLNLLALAGLTVFAVSGALVAARQRLDIVAAGFFAVVTATGGGTLRDIMIGAPVFWLRDWVPVTLCVVTAVAVWLVPLRRWPVRALDWFDAAGLAAFAVYGTAKAVGAGVSPLPAVAMGVVTACLGGVTRDMVAGVPSIMLRNELYVTAALAGGLAFVGLLWAGVTEGSASRYARRGSSGSWHSRAIRADRDAVGSPHAWNRSASTSSRIAGESWRRLG